jgi:hypothetical protein
LARTAAVSEVEVSVSTDSELNVRATTRRKAASSRSAGTAASVKTRAIIVAMSGSIMPTPLAMPTTDAPPARADATLGRVSVVMMARAAATASVPAKGGRTAARPARTRSIG